MIKKEKTDHNIVGKESKIIGGYYIKARCIEQSEVAHSSPCVRETFDWLLRRANHKDAKCYGRTIKRGQVLCTYQDIREGLHWKAGFRKITYTKWQCEEALKKLRRLAMVTTAKTTRGLIITICNYDYYQKPANYEHHYGHHDCTQLPDTINKNDKNDKKKERKRGRFVAPSAQEISEYAKSIDFALEGIVFVDYYKTRGWKLKGGQPMKDWKAAVRTWKNRRKERGNGEGRNNRPDNEYEIPAEYANTAIKM